MARAWLLCVAVLLLGTPALAAEPRPVASEDLTGPGSVPFNVPPPAPPLPSPLKGIGAAMASTLPPIVAGSVLWTVSSQRAGRNAGAALVEGGLLLGPVVGHLVVGEPRRALVFGAISAGLGSLMATVIGLYPDVTSEPIPDGAGKLGRQAAFYTILSASFLVSALGVLDVLGAPERAAKGRRLTPAVTAVPPLRPGQAPGVVLGVTLDLDGRAAGLSVP